MTPFTAKLLPSVADPSRTPPSTPSEAALREALRTARNLITSLKNENTRLRTINLKSQRVIKKPTVSRSARGRSEHKHARLSALLYELESLQTRTQRQPPQARQKFSSDASIKRLARAVHEEENGAPYRERRGTNLQLCLEHLLGATLQCGNQSAVLIDMKNPESGNKLEFELRWDEDHIEYTRREAQFSGELPDLAQEEGMHFEIAQGPNFLKELLLCMYPSSPISPSPQSPQPGDANPSA
ncbi:unnamed protein product [Agarophyton chilense]